MAVFTYYKAVDSATDGSKGSQVSSSEIGAILPYLSSQDRIDGVTRLEKMYVQSDTTMNVYIGLTSLGLFTCGIMDSTGTSEVSGDVPSDRPRFGASKILSNDADGCVIEHNTVEDLFRANDYILVGDVVVQIDTITANTTDRTITYKFSIPYVDLVGTNASSVFSKSLTAGTASPLWFEDIVEAGSPATQTYNTLPLVIVS